MDDVVLVAAGDRRVVEQLSPYLQREGFSVAAAGDGREALDSADRLRPRLVVLDLCEDGWEVCRRLREESDVPIIVLTARNRLAEVVAALELGADDYVAKPFDGRELVARVRAVLRRCETRCPPAARLRVGDMRLDPARQTIDIGGRPVHLRVREFHLLLALAQEQGRVLSRESLLVRAWGYSYLGEGRTVDVHVGRLRSKLAGSQVEIHTIRGSGYKLTVRTDG